MKFTKKNGFSTNQQRSDLMRKIRSTNTKPELTLRKLLWANGYRFRINYKSLPGSPDIVFTKYKVVVFIDGEFWHGHKWEEKKLKLKSNTAFWIPKIERNISRDLRNNEDLERLGYTVLRFWSTDVLKRPNFYLNIVIEKLHTIIKDNIE